MRKNDKIIWSIIGVSLVLILVLGAVLLIPGKADETRVTPAPQLEHIKIGYKATSHYLPVYVTEEKGFFEEEGLDAELVRFESSNQIMDAVIAGQLDAARGGSVLQFLIEEKQPGTLKTVTLNNQTDISYVDYLIVRNDSDIRTINDLEGKKIGANTGAVEEAYLKVIMRNASVDKYEIIGLKPELLSSALATGQVDAIYAYEPEANIAVKKAGGRIIETALFAHRINNPLNAGGVFMRTELIEKNPEKADKIIRAFYKAGEFIEKNPDECRKIIMKYTAIDEETADELHILGEYKPDEALVRSLQQHADIMYENGVLKKDIDVSKMMYVIES